ncbi:hypothetical protein FPOAC1_001030 [Fusarium poae]|uniref:hypothetical protein n=1 Tax=Fusarium poae TaxID=36050 RepID=UPI001CEAE3F2|nr:hypothetical protein FPOAC1_001030 [Fusarium poae]KAG8675054.1 hypothetical protein FPOAC1_001030 [Fusarium poae]
MKLTSWATCSLGLIAGVLGIERPELFKGLPNCTSPCLDLYSDSILDITDICNDKSLKNEIDNCIAHQCSDFERFEVAKIYTNACAEKPEDNRFDHYILLLAEVPAWTFVWLRLYLGWVTYERLALDDYVMTVCGLIYTAFIPLVHLSYTAADSTIDSTTIPGFITDALKFVYLTEIAEIACSCLLRVSILLVCLRTTLSSHHMIATGATIVFTLASSIVLILLRVFRCSPIAFSWEAWALRAFALAVSGLRAQLLVDFFTKMKPVWEYHDRLIWMDIEIAVLILWACSPVWQFFADSDSNDSEVQNQSTLLITNTDTPTKRGTNYKSTKTAIRSTGFLGMLTRSRTKKKFSPALHLGDKTYGDVRTEIQGGQRFSMISQFTDLIGIQVKTRTVRRVEDNEWDAEKGVARANIKADD